MNKPYETEFETLMGQALDNHYQRAVSYLDEDSLKEAYENIDRFWEGEDSDPLFSDYCSPYHGVGLAWNAAKEAVDKLADEEVETILSEIDPLFLESEFEHWNYANGILYTLDGDKEDIEYKRALLASDLIYGYIEQTHTPITQYNVEEAIKDRYETEGLVEGSPADPDDFRGLWFFHGLESTPHGTKYKALAEVDSGFESPDFQGMDLDERYEKALDLVTSRGPNQIIVGSSMGAKVALNTKDEAPTYIFGCVLLAPAIHLDLYEFHDIDYTFDNITVVHGTQDEIISLDKVRKYCERFNFELIVVEDDHRLHKPESLAVIQEAVRKLIAKRDAANQIEATRQLFNGTVVKSEF